ncbi:carbohydrate kinase family protein [Vibrio viridaestus]|uniref:Carbohydrate kinase n=1 Tax=Vibrio viridaestus TaxID=2487322 RepID=A0A3N9TYQ1_9VIBR|nr:carbohydrate kinase [Vibrio viridaestus]RQW62062.1 carbohydrate kinase [Vibrio viridaestus]
MSFSRNVACVGELLIDFVCSDIGTDLSQGEHFVKKAGGAPANVACAISRLGGQAKLAAKVGNDPFGEFLINTVKAEGVDITSVIKAQNQATTLAFVALQQNGERDFSFNWGAHDNLSYDELAKDFVEDSSILHLGAALTEGNIVTLYRKLIAKAKTHSKLISFDPNFRDALWAGKDQKYFRDLCHEFIGDTDILKVSEEEAMMIAEAETPVDSASVLHKLGARMVLITLGAQGTLISYEGSVEIISSTAIRSVDSTGAGDAFIGAMLFQVSNQDKLPSQSDALEMVRFANKVGAITCTNMGAIQALPYYHEIQ